MVVVSDIKSAIRKNEPKDMNLNRTENIIAPDNEMIKAPASETVNRKSRCSLGEW